MFHTFSDYSNFGKLLSLCQEYQVTWLTEQIKDYLERRIDVYTQSYTNQSIKTPGINPTDILLLAEQYNLDELKSKIIQGIKINEIKYYEEHHYHGNRMVENPSFQSLTYEAKYLLARQNIQNAQRKAVERRNKNPPKEENESSFLLNFLDSIFQ